MTTLALLQIPVSNLKGKKYGKWKVLSFVEKRRRGKTVFDVWLCRCKCGAEHEVLRGNLIKGYSTKCAKCARKIGKKFPWTKDPAIQGRYYNIRTNIVSRWRKISIWYEQFGKYYTKEKPYIRRHDESKPHGPHNSYWSEISNGYKGSREKAVAVLIAQGSTEKAAWKRINKLTRARIQQIGNKKPCIKCGKPCGREQSTTNWCNECWKKYRPKKIIKPRECKTCRIVIGKGKQYCEKCGVPSSRWKLAQRTCKKCGAPIGKGKQYCEECRSKIKYG